MAEQQAPETQINLTLGTAGHIDHGKTALVRLLTGCETDRLKEEKQRGMSIDLGYAPCRIARTEIGIVDVPGHETFIRTMVAGAAGMDAVLLVVAADDGVMPQTREHMEILTLLGVKSGFVALTKIDRVSPDRVEEVREEIETYLGDTFLRNRPICPISSITGQGFDQFHRTLVETVESIPPRRLEGIFRMPLDRAFSARGHGTVVAGVPVSGTMRLGDSVVLHPGAVEGSCRKIQVYGRDASMVKAGQCAAINVGNWDAGKIRRGNVVSLPGFFEPSRWYAAKLKLLSDANPILSTGAQVQFHTGTSQTLASMYLMENNQVVNGEETLVQFRLKHPVVAGPGDPYIIRMNSGGKDSAEVIRTIGGGILLEAIPHRLKRNRPGVLEDLRRRADAVGDEKRFLQYCLKRAPDRVTDFASLIRRVKITPKQGNNWLEELHRQAIALPLAGNHWIHRDTLEESQRELLDRIAHFHRQRPDMPAMPIEELRQTFDGSKQTVDLLLDRLAQEKAILHRQGQVAMPDHRVRFQGKDAERLEAIEAALKETPFQPPGPAKLAERLRTAEGEIHRLLKILIENDRVVRVEGKLFFHAEAVEEARDKLVDYLKREGELESVKFKYLLDTSRKFAIPLLDHFDRIGVTRRQGYTRLLRRP